MKKFTLLVLVMLICSAPLYSRPKIVVSLSNMHPAYPEWYKRYNLSLSVNPSSRFGLRVGVGSLDFEYEDFDIGSYSYGGVDGLLYLASNDNVSLYTVLNPGISYSSGGYYGGSSFSFYSTVGFGVDWYFLERAAFSVEVQDLLWFYWTRYDGDNEVGLDGHPGVIFGLKFGIY